MTSLRTTFTRLLVFSGLLSFAIALPTTLQAASDDIDREFDVSAGGTLVINSDAGHIDVNTWNQNSVRIRISSTNGFDVEVNQVGYDVRVLAEAPRRSLFGNRRSNIRFQADVPVNYNVQLDTGGGHIEVADITGNVDVDTSGGHIEIGAVSQGNVRADTSGGHITIDSVDGNVEADTSGGRITIGDVTGDASADTSGGSIVLGNVGGDMVADTSGGNIEINGGHGSVTADTSGGNITIRGTLGPVDADTSGGRIDVDLSAVSGSIGGDVRLETAGGDVTVRIPGNLPATITAELEISRRARGDYRIYTDFPLSISEDDDLIVGRGDINGGGDRILIETRNSDIHIIRVAN